MYFTGRLHDTCYLLPGAFKWFDGLSKVEVDPHKVEMVKFGPIALDPSPENVAVPAQGQVGLSKTESYTSSWGVFEGSQVSSNDLCIFRKGFALVVLQFIHG